MMEPARFILMKDVQGYKLNGAVLATLKRAIGDEPHTPVNILRGELVEEVKSDVNFNLRVWHDPTIMLRCCDDDVAPLYSPEEFLLMEGILSPGERFDALHKGQVGLGLKVKEGCKVYVAIPGRRKYARAVIHYKGKVGNLPGTMFGVEILESDCMLGISDGTFQEKRYFKCNDGNGLFVPVDKLSWCPHKGDGATRSARLSMYMNRAAQNTRSIVESSVDSPPSYQIGEHVCFHDRRSNLLNGVVRWIGKETPRGLKKFDYVVIGIQTDDEIFKCDFENSIIGMDHLIKPTRWNHTLFLPETMVDKVPVEAECDRLIMMESLASNLAKELHMSMDELMSEQSKILEEAVVKKNSLYEHKVAVDMTRLAREDTSNFRQQEEEYRRLQKESRLGIVQKEVQCQPLEKQYLESNYDVILPSPKGSLVQKHRNMQQQGDYHVEQCSGSSISQIKDHERAHFVTNYREERSPSSGVRFGRSYSSSSHGGDRPPSSSGAVTGYHGGFTQGSSVVVSTGEGPPLNIGVGYLIEIPCASKSGPVRYGVVKWIGHLPKVEGQLAGIELDEHMEGCTDGSWTDLEGHTHRFFHCSMGKGLYYPLNCLQLDPRYESLDGNFAAPTKRISTEHDDKFKSVEDFSPEDEDEHVQELKQQQLHQRIDRSKEEILKMKFTNLHGESLEELDNVCENCESKVNNMALLIQSKEKEINRLTGIIQSKDIEVQEMEELIESKEIERCIEIERSSSILHDREVANMKMTEELQSNKLELQQMATKIEDLQQQLDSNESLLQLTGLQDSDAPWKIDRSEITRIPKKQIGSGAWGLVYSAHFRGEPVAIKIAHREVLLGVEGTLDMIKREISIMAHIQHPNLVRFIGAVVDKRVDNKMDTPIIVLELLDMDLREAYGRERLERSKMSSIFCDVAYALHYLHDQREAIIHRDISAPNILLKRLPHGLFKAKVSDLGSANLVKDSRTAGAGAIIYTAPEMFPQDISSAQPPQTTKVDVFSYGILLLEVFSKAIPTTDKRHSLLQALKTKWEGIYDLIVCCTQQSPSDRPTMRVILNILNRMEHKYS